MTSDWSYYYGDETNNPIENNCKQSKVQDSNSNYLIFHCCFIQLTELGAVRFENGVGSIKTLIESTIFDSCRSTKNGGSLFFQIGHCVQAFNCYYNSSTSGTNCIAYYVLGEYQTKNYANTTSISVCGTDSDTSSISTLHRTGVIHIDNSNNSYCLSSTYPAFSVECSTTPDGSQEHYIKYLTCKNNTSINDDSSIAQCNTVDLKISNSNFLGNNRTTDKISTLMYCSDTVTFTDCCFKENICENTFYIASGKRLMTYNCYYDADTVTGDGNSQLMRSNLDDNPISISHLYLGKCIDFRYPETQLFNKNLHFMRFNSEFEIFILAQFASF